MINEVRYLIIFAKVVEKGSFTAAAKELNMSTATTSLYVSKLEDNLGVALLYRNTRKLSLTSDGESVYSTAREILGLYEREVIQFNGAQTDRFNRKFKIAIPSVLIKSALLREVGVFFSCRPKIRFSVVCSDSHNDIVGEGLDLAIRLGKMPDSSLRAKRLFSIERKLVATREFLENSKTVRYPKDLELLNWIGLTMRPNFRTFRNAEGRTVEISYSPVIVVDNVEASYKLACSGVGLAAPPEFLIDEKDNVQVVLPEWRLDPLPAYAVWPANTVAGSVTHDLIRHLEYSFSSSDSIGIATTTEACHAELDEVLA